MEIIVLGRGCTKCNLTEEMIRKVVSEECITAKIEKVTDTMKIASYGVFGTPAVIIEGEVKSVGKIPTKDEIKSWIEN